MYSPCPDGRINKSTVTAKKSHKFCLIKFSRLCREISFQFRTRLPHGLLVYHNVKTPAGIKLDPYALYVIVEKGQLKVVHVFGNHSTSVTVGEGLNRDEWHSVMVSIQQLPGIWTVDQSEWTTLCQFIIIAFVHSSWGVCLALT